MTTADPKAKRRNKSSYLRHAAKKPRGSRELEAGMQGLLITCNMNERKCTAEAYSLLNEYADQLYGPEKFVEESNSEDEEDDDAEAALKKEVKQISASTQKQLRRFQALDSGANNVVFIRTHDIEPDKLVHHILKDLHTTKKKKTRAILRMLPVSGSCKAFMEEIPKYFETFLEPWFKVPKKATFQIVYKARNNSHMNRDDVIKALAGVVANLNAENKVDLSFPEYTIIVEIIKGVCCVSVVRDYVLFRKYNLQEVTKNDMEEKSKKNTCSPSENNGCVGSKEQLEEKKPNKKVEDEGQELEPPVMGTEDVFQEQKSGEQGAEKETIYSESNQSES
ncbi:THUMP domain-containing protein 1 [Pristis pectinata]|uniref:THUMP domain-containing protein 1 n=1 Tax=Pristis pectinata TaxID=685728 RepID=UPI00223DD515|nr:THUMP domain-containing protein 1 [Pristis pectinata]XP_051877156.1 THUMP domain-containing protein 1 [Pristis pectinata]XP_051877157.1 THUMP domain-containing protein 1 [Pristis pectinata]